MPQRTKALKRRINRNPVARQRKGKWDQQRNSDVLWSKTKKQEVTRKFKGTKKKENYIRSLKVLSVGKCLILILIKSLIRSQRGLWSARDPLFINHGDDTPQLPSHHYSLEHLRLHPHSKRRWHTNMNIRIWKSLLPPSLKSHCHRWPLSDPIAKMAYIITWMGSFLTLFALIIWSTGEAQHSVPDPCEYKWQIVFLTCPNLWTLML